MNIAQCQQHFEQYLTQFFTKQTLLPVPVLKEAMTYSVLAGGKRFRPVLVYLVAQAISGSKPIIAQANSASCAIELIHIYSLIHDDLPAMDDDNWRHYQPSCHIKHGQAMAILAGDALQTLAFNVLATDKNVCPTQCVAMMAELSQYALNMVGGQALDLDSAGQTIDIDYLKTMYEFKTGALLRCAVALGAIVAGGEKSLLKSLDQFACYLGLAYQIQDDVLDVLSSKEVLGKQPGSDIINNKITYVSLLGVDKASDLFGQYYHQALEVLNTLDIKKDELINLVEHFEKRQF